MSYIPKSLDKEQQAQVLKVWDAHCESSRQLPIAEFTALTDIRKILAEPPTERAPKGAQAKKETAAPPPAPKPKQ